MTRPHISRKEAAYVLDCLEFSDPAIRAMQEHYEHLKKEVAELRRNLWTETYRVTKEHYAEKKNELARLEVISFDLWKHLELHNRLKLKYKAVAQGETHRGTYKHYSTIINDALTPSYPIQQVTLRGSSRIICKLPNFLRKKDIQVLH